MQSGLTWRRRNSSTSCAGLPEKQIGADRRAEDRDHGHGMRRIEGDVRHERAEQRGAPWHVRGEDDGHIGEQATASPT